MPDLNAFGIPFATPDDPVQSVAQTMHDQSDALIKLVPVPVFAAAAGWGSLSQAVFRVLGEFALWVELTVTRTGADISSATGGNVSPDVTVATVADTGFRPLRVQQLEGGPASGLRYSFRYTDAGDLNLAALVPGVNLPTGQTVTLQGWLCLK